MVKDWNIFANQYNKLTYFHLLCHFGAEFFLPVLVYREKSKIFSKFTVINFNIFAFSEPYQNVSMSCSVNSV